MIQNFQELAWKRFFTQELPLLFKEKSFEHKGVLVELTPSNTGDFIKRKDVHGVQEVSETLYYNIDMTLMDSNVLNSRVTVRELPFANFPVFTQDGFIMNGTHWTIVSECVPASGWYFESLDEGTHSLTLCRGSLPLLRILQTKKGKIIVAPTGRNSSSQAKNGIHGKDVTLFQFLKALSPSLSYDDIYSMFSMAPLITELYVEEEELPIDICAHNVLKMLGYSSKGTSSNEVQFLQDRFFNNGMRIGPERMPRFQNSQSFSRAVGCVLDMDVDLGSSVITAGTVLTEPIIKVIEDANVQAITVRFNKQRRRLYKITPEENITFEEVCAVVYNFLLFCDGLGTEDDRDSYANKVLSSVSADFEKEISNQLDSIQKIIRDNINQLNGNQAGGQTSGGITDLEGILNEKLTKRNLNCNTFKDLLRRAGTTQQLEETNSIANFGQSFQLTRTASSLPNRSRDVQVSQKGRVCPYTTSESDRVGINTSLSALASVDNYGFLCTPYLKVVNGVVTNEKVNLNPIDERGKLIATLDLDLSPEAGNNPNDITHKVRLNGEMVSATFADIDYQEVSSMALISPLISMIPSAERDAGKRLIMSVKAQQQAIPVVNRERAFVTTGAESLMDVGIVRAKQIIQTVLQEVDIAQEPPEDTTLTLIGIENNGATNVIKFTTNWKVLPGVYQYTLNCMNSTMKSSPKHQRIRNVEPDADGNHVYHLNDVVAHNYDIDDTPVSLSSDTVSFGNMSSTTGDISNHAVALGNNVKVLFKSWEGSGYEDSIIINQDFVAQYGLAIITAKKIKYTLQDGEKFEYSSVSSDRVPYMDMRGLPKLGTLLKAGQDAIIRCHRGDNDIIRYPSIKLQPGERGYVISSTITEDGKTAEVILGDVLHLEEGDKLAGTHGNKGVVGRIVPKHEMPFMADGEIPDIILNPLGVLSRSNLGQMTEHEISFIGMKTGEVQVLPPFSGVQISEICKHAEELGLTEMDVYDGRTGRKFDKKGTLGVMHFLRLEHIATSKYNACADGADVINQRTLQANRSAGGGQRISELTTWCLNSYGATTLLDSLMTVQSDDVIGKLNLRDCIKHDIPTGQIQYESNNFGLLQAFYRILGLNIIKDGDDIQLQHLTSEDIKQLSNGDCDLARGDATDENTQYSMLRDPDIFGSWEKGEEDLIKSREFYGRLPLKCEIVMPIFVNQAEWCNLFTCEVYSMPKTKTGTGNVKMEIRQASVNLFKEIANGKAYLFDWVQANIAPERMSRYEAAYGVTLGDLEYPCVTSSETIADMAAINPKNSGISAIVELVKRFNPVVTLTCLEDRMRSLMNKAVIPAADQETFMKVMDCPQSVTDSDKQTYFTVINTVVEAVESGNISVKSNEDIRKLIEDRNTVREFILHDDLASFVVDGIAVPPIGYRPTYKDSPTTGMDLQLRAVISAVKRLMTEVPESAAWYLAQRNVYASVNAMISSDAGSGKNSKNKTVLEELTSHGTHHSIMRDTLLAKRITHSGRSVISVNSKLKLGEAGIPISIASKILEDFIVVELRNNASMYPELGSLSFVSSTTSDSGIARKYKKLLVYLSNNNINGFAEACHLDRDAYSKFAKCKLELIAILDKLFDKWVVLLGREPSLHKFSLEAFRGVPVDTYSIQLHPLACHGFNADFDGDQMMVAIPVHEAGNRDAREKMMIQDNLINPKDCELICSINQDMILGLYYATIFKNNATTLDMSSVSAYYFDQNVGRDPQFDGMKPNCFSQLYEDIQLGLIKFQDTVAVECDGRLYVSTAGRVLLNTMYSNKVGFTDAIKLGAIMTDAQGAQLAQEYASFKEKAKDSFERFDIPEKFSQFVEDNCVKYRGKPVYELRTDMIMSKDTIKYLTKSAIKYYFDVHKAQPDEQEDTLAMFLDRIKDYGFMAADYSGITLSLFDFDRLPIPGVVDQEMPAIQAKDQQVQEAYDDGMITEVERRKLTINNWQGFKKNLSKNIDSALRQEDNKMGIKFDPMDNIYLMVASGARGSTGQLLEISGIIGNVTNASGQMLESPILSNYMNGLNTTESFDNSFTARRQVMAAQLSTAQAGTTTRELIYDNEHLHIRDSDDVCDADSGCIKLEYTPTLSVQLGTPLVLSQDEIDSIPEEFWDSIEGLDYKDEWKEFANTASKVLINQTVSSEMDPLLQLAMPPYLIIKDRNANGWTPKAAPVMYTLTNKSKYMLLYRCIDMSKVPSILKPEFEKCAALVLPDKSIQDPERQQASLHPEWPVIGEEMIRLIQDLRMQEVYIYTMLGCKSTKGICKRCFGLKYDTRTFPMDMEYIGYQAVQSIGEPIAQLVLDSHKKTEANDGSSSLKQLQDLMGKPLNHEGVAKISPAWGKVMLQRNANEPSMIDLYLARKDMALDYVTTCLAKDLNVMNDASVSPGTILTKGSVSYHEMAQHSNFLDVQIQFWTDFLSVFGDEKIMARNFECLARSQTEFGTAMESGTDIQIGSVYPVNKLREEGIKFKPSILPYTSAMRTAGKMFSTLALREFKRNAVYHIVHHTKESPDSNIGRSLIGDLQTAPLPEQMGVISQTTKHDFAADELNKFSKIVRKPATTVTQQEEEFDLSALFSQEEPAEPEVKESKENVSEEVVTPVEQHNPVTEPVEEVSKTSLF